MLKKIRGAVSLILCAVLVFILAANLYTIYAQKVKGMIQPTVLGYSSAVVVSGSMSGAIEVNDLVVTKRCDGYAVGDIIMFRSGGSSVTHRIVAVTEEGYVTKGDANNAPDGEIVTPEAVVGRVILVIPRFGLVVGFLQTPQGMLGVSVLVLLIGLLPGWPGKRQEGGAWKDEANEL